MIRIRQLLALTLGVLAVIAVALPTASACPWGGGHFGPAYGPGYGPAYGPAGPIGYAPPMYAPPMYYGPAQPAPQMLPGGMVPTVPVRPMPGPMVTARDDMFEPATLNIQPGTTVRWVNDGKHPHTVTDRGGKFDSGDIAPGSSYSATFQTPGTYKYHCKHHKGMEGTIVVGQTGSAPAAGGVGGAKGPSY